MRPLEAVPNNLPAQLTSFIGRASERAAAAQLIATNRLVTLTGAGGCGKTRLSLQVASDMALAYPDGVFWVDLARLADETLLANTVAVALSIKEIPGQAFDETIENHLRNKNALLILDNCEHVVAASAQLVHRLLRSCPSLSILTTSREPVGVEGEIAWRVPSLSVPEEQDPPIESVARSEAAQLFVERAARVRRTFGLTEENASFVAEICRRLDGIPLAIELAAARTRMMTPEQIVEGLADRFHLLTGASRTALPRHQTLRASVEWSFGLLSDEERTVFRRLGVFVGGFTLEAAEEVCGDEPIGRHEVLDVVSRLVDRSLVQAGDEQPATRFRMLETIRQYAVERLIESGEGDAVRDRHLHYFVALAERAWPELEGSGLLEWLPRLDPEHDNIRAAFDWSARAGATEETLRIAVGLWNFWQVRGHLTEGRRRLEMALTSDAHPHLRVEALVAAGQIMAYYGDLAATKAFAEDALEIARRLGDERLLGRALDSLGYALAFLDSAAAPETFHEAIAFSRKAGDKMFLADALNGLGIARYFAGDYAGARAALEEGVECAREIGNTNMLTIGLGVLGYTLGLQGYLARARTCLRESLPLARRLGDRVWTAQAHYGLGFIEAHRGEYERAESHLDESVALGREVSPMILSFALLTQGIARYVRADLDGAASALEEAFVLAREMGPAWSTAWSLALLGNAARIGGDLETARSRIDEALTIAKDAGVRIDVAIDAAARLSRDTGDFERAESLHHEALEAAREAESVLHVPAQLEALAGLAALAESFAEAARLFGAADAARDAYGLARYAVDDERYHADVQRVRAGLSEGEFVSAWEQGRAMSVDEAVAYASRGRGERKRPSSGWASLTPTEIEVVRQVAEGLKNAQIAERLFVSPSTVKVHLSHIFAKLGIATRSELAAQATRRGL